MIVANSGAEIILLNLTNDGVDEPNSTITIRVTGCTGVTVADDCEVVTTSSNTASTVVADDEVPKISISGPTSANDVVGNNPNTVTFTLEADIIPHDTINIKSISHRYLTPTAKNYMLEPIIWVSRRGQSRS